MSEDQSNWRELAEQASTEQDPERLLSLVEQLTGMLSRREADCNVGRRRNVTVNIDQQLDPLRLILRPSNSPRYKKCRTFRRQTSCEPTT